MKKFLSILILGGCLAAFSGAQTPAPVAPVASVAPVAAAPAAPPVPITDADIKGVAPPAADARAKGDPDGSLTGTVSDIAVSDSKKGLTLADVLNQIGQNKIAVNFVWTLVCGFLVMFMQ